MGIELVGEKDPFGFWVSGDCLLDVYLKERADRSPTNWLRTVIADAGQFIPQRLALDIDNSVRLFQADRIRKYG